MVSKRSQKIVFALILGLSLMVGSVVSAVAANNKKAGEVTPIGAVLINGATIKSSATIFSDSHITTNSSSGATANLGSAGQIFVGENSDVTVSFQDNLLQLTLNKGSLRVKCNSDSSARVTTRTNTKVFTKSGSVDTIKEGSDGKVITIASKSGSATDFLVETVSGDSKAGAISAVVIGSGGGSTALATGAGVSAAAATGVAGRSLFSSIFKNSSRSTNPALVNPTATAGTDTNPVSPIRP